MSDLKASIARRGRFARIRIATEEVRDSLSRLEQRGGPITAAEASLAGEIGKLAKCIEDLAILTEDG